MINKEHGQELGWSSDDDYEDFDDKGLGFDMENNVQDSSSLPSLLTLANETTGAQAGTQIGFTVQPYGLIPVPPITPVASFTGANPGSIGKCSC